MKVGLIGNSFTSEMQKSTGKLFGNVFLLGRFQKLQIIPQPLHPSSLGFISFILSYSAESQQTFKSSAAENLLREALTCTQPLGFNKEPARSFLLSLLIKVAKSGVSQSEEGKFTDCSFDDVIFMKASAPHSSSDTQGPVFPNQ